MTDLINAVVQQEQLFVTVVLPGQKGDPGKDADTDAIEALIDAEAATRAAADTAEASARSTGDATEAAARATADTDLDSRIDVLEAISFATDAELAASVAAEAATRAAADALLIPLTQKGAANGVATLGSDSKIPNAQLPALAIQEALPAASQAAMLALDAQRGDIALRSDVNKVFMLTGDDPTVLVDWVEWLYPGGGVASFNGRVGVVVPATNDYSVAQINGLQAALDEKATEDDLTGEANIRAAADNALDGRVDLEEAATISHAARLAALESAEPPPPTAAVGTFLEEGATLAWVSGLTFRVGAGNYQIAFVPVTSPEQNITLAAADATHPRFDVIVLDATGTADSITGTPAANPAIPSVDPDLYLEIRPVLVAAGAVAVPVTETTIWKEDTGTDWTAVPSAGTIVIASTNVPRSGTKSIEGTAVAAGTNVLFTIDSASLDLATQEKLVYYIRNKAAWPTNKAMRLQWLVGTVPVGVAVTVGNGQFGFQRSLTGVHQQIVVPMSSFGVPAGSAVTKLKWEIIGGGAAVGFYLDDMITQAGAIGGGSASQYRWRGTWSSAAAYATNDEVGRSGSTYIALQPSTNQDPVSAAVYWVKTGITAFTTAAEGNDSTEPATTAFVQRAVAHQPEVLIIPVGDETTVITSGVDKIKFRVPFGCTLAGVRASLNTASSSGVVTVDINEAGGTLLSTKLTIDQGETTSVTAATAAVISDNALADDAVLTIDIDGAGTGAVGLKITLYLVRTS